MAQLCAPQNQALGVCRGFVPDIQVCGTHGREDLVNATITLNAEEEELEFLVIYRPVVKAPASTAEDPGLESRLRRGFSGSSHTSDLKIGTPVATVLDAWGYRSALGLVGPVSVYCDWAG